MLHPPLPLILRIECREPCEINGYEIHLKTKVTVNAKLMKRSCMLAWCYEFYFRKFCLQLNWIRWDSLWIYPFWGGKEDIELPLAQLPYHFDWELPGRMTHEDQIWLTTLVRLFKGKTAWIWQLSLIILHLVTKYNRRSQNNGDSKSENPFRWSWNSAWLCQSMYK